MLLEDKKRLERERDIYNATHLGGPSITDQDIARAKAEWSKRMAAYREYIAQQEFGYYQDAPERHKYPFRERS